MRHESEHQRRWHQSFVLLLLLGAVAAFSLLIQTQLDRNRAKPVTIGITYSTKYAYWLGLDSHKAFISMMDDLGAKSIRVPVYWTDVEKSSGAYDWSEAKWMLDEAAKRNVAVTIVIGMRVPRYPECFVPDWVKQLSPDDASKQLMEYLKSGVQALDSEPSLVRWQVENEPLFGYFGECPPPNEQMFAQEVSTVRELTKKPIMTTTSGEFGSWVAEGKLVDELGISLYRGAYLSKLGYFAYPIPPWFYIIRRDLASGTVKKSLISELQVEPWLTDDTQKVPVDEQLRGMSLDKIKENVEFARSTGFSEVWLWGPEWWLYLKQIKGIDSYWELGKSLMK